ncbi:DNA-processing protein DprA [Tengunoibacter tsumagoiensis]|uniref:Smf/DprA SLOG domain-containing protein n=1 Tax=Tengunoibacter tsumagoiensis TaxID=2014871 RepID=A0A401ZWY1_9CHLR|nr:DNA-processing protein DprA [Tengunoibacter tsumagoiensis]GCE11368.1 hypothetical protein KTT_12270 [Tengunoibacter tsumagoiensis]
MQTDPQEQAAWLLLTFESGLTTRAVNDILVIWCKQLGRTVCSFWAASAAEWEETCQLSPVIIHRLEEARARSRTQSQLLAQLQQQGIQQLTVLDEDYPKQLKTSLTRSHTPPMLFYLGDLSILQQQTIAIIGSRNACEESITFTHLVSQYLSTHGVNVISGYARGVDRAAFDGASQVHGRTTLILPHGLCKLSKAQVQHLQEGIKAGEILVISQFAPAAPWVVSRAMERNYLVSALAQTMIVAEAETKGGTWDGANTALRLKRPLYVRELAESGNAILINKGGIPLAWPTDDLATLLSPVLTESLQIQSQQNEQVIRPNQLSLLATPHE